MTRLKLGTTVEVQIFNSSLRIFNLVDAIVAKETDLESEISKNVTKLFISTSKIRFFKKIAEILENWQKL